MPADREAFARGFATMRHRGPDHSEIRSSTLDLPMSDGKSPIHWIAGHHRLAILDLDPRAHQPFQRDGDMLLFNGEIYNYRDVRTAQPLNGTAFSTEGDTEVLFRGLQQAGYDVLGQMNGMWAFLFLDAVNGRLLASRDRFGKKPLFWYLDSEQVIFSSTLGAIDTYLGRSPRYRIEAAQTYLTYGRLFPGGKETTHHADIDQVRPSGVLTVDLGAWTATPGTYFGFRETEPPTGAKLHEWLADSVRLRLVSDRPVGLLLSGGIDSSLILSVAAATGQSDKLRYLLGDTGKSEDAQYAYRAIEALQLPAERVEVQYTGQAFDQFLEVCRHQEKPFTLNGNAMAMGSMYEAVKRHGIAVALDGTGGDELFGGYWNRYLPFAIRDAFRNGDYSWLIGIARNNLTHLKQLVPTIPFSVAPKRRSGSSGLLGALARFDVSRVTDSDPLSDTRLTFAEALKFDATAGRLGEWLWQNDRNAMMFSIENRSPLLDFRLGAFLFTGYSAKFNGPWNKLELRRQFDGFRRLPTQWRIQKQGFRWDRRRFLTQNRRTILEIIAASRTVETLVNRAEFVERAARDERYFNATILHRLAVLAGLEAATGMDV
jgi:asparagine synthase (glutamine-hydrolysing)